jgi:hypothetical protein
MGFYRENPWQFITDWGMTHDPRNPEIGLPSSIPFLLYTRQEEWAKWFFERWRARENGLSDKSRAVGLTWIAVAMACTLALFYDEVIFGFGSRKEEYVDKLGDPKCILYKARAFMRMLPVEFRGGWNKDRHAPHMRIEFPGTNSVIIGEAGNNIGRGNRVSAYFLDESAHVLQPELIEASLSETTNCRIDISTPRGRNNPFGRKRWSGEIPVFSFHWRDDPTKDEAWYEKRKKMIGDPVIIAQELDLDYSASIEGVIIPATWVWAAVDAHKTLGIKPTGVRRAALDVADAGRDLNAFCGRYGILIEFLEEWTGKESDIFVTAKRAVALMDVFGYEDIYYDADGLGAGVRGDARVINRKRKNNGLKPVDFRAFHGSGAVLHPEREAFLKRGETREAGRGRTNEDFFGNFKAQAWWALKHRFWLTYQTIQAHKENDENWEYDPNDLISISSAVTDSEGKNLLQKLVAELSQPTYYEAELSGKMYVDKLPDGARSPNLADAVMIAFAPTKKIRGGLSV